MFPLNRDMGGILILSEFIIKSEYNYCGFKFFLPFASAGVVDLLATGGVNALINSGAASGSWGGKTVEEWSAIPGVEGFWLMDEPINKGYSDIEIKGWYDTIKARTSKPVGCIFSYGIFQGDHLDCVNYMDFVLIDMYPYWEGDSPGDAEGRIATFIENLTGVTVPLIVVAQGQDLVQYGRDPGEEGIRYQHNAYYNEHYPICWYTWKDAGLTDIKRNYQYLMNEFYVNGGDGVPGHIILQPSDMLKEHYDVDKDNTVDNSERLAGLTLEQVRDHPNGGGFVEGNGYIRFGTVQICWGTITIVINGVENSGDWVFPIAFNTTPKVFAVVNSGMSYWSRYYSLFTEKS